MHYDLGTILFLFYETNVYIGLSLQTNYAHNTQGICYKRYQYYLQSVINVYEKGT